MVRPMADGRQLELKVRIGDAPAVMLGDQRRFEQVFLNLLNNAIKFTESGSILLDVQTLDSGDGTPKSLRIAVSDTGVGIKQEDLPQLFQPFSQIDTGISRQYEGTGLGLVICRRLLSLMGGSIEVTSEWGQGSEFMVTLPLSRSKQS